MTKLGVDPLSKDLFLFRDFEYRFRPLNVSRIPFPTHQSTPLAKARLVVAARDAWEQY